MPNVPNTSPSSRALDNCALASVAVPPDAAAEVTVSIELGRSSLAADDAFKLSEGSLVSLDKQADEAVEVFADGRLVARGQLMVLEGNFCVRVSEIVAGVKEEGN